MVKIYDLSINPRLKYLVEAVLNETSKYHFINDRILTVQQLNYGVMETPVLSGGIGSVFYLPRKKEYRVQIGCSKGSMALYAYCAIIPEYLL